MFRAKKSLCQNIAFQNVTENFYCSKCLRTKQSLRKSDPACKSVLVQKCPLVQNCRRAKVSLFAKVTQRAK